MIVKRLMALSFLCLFSWAVEVGNALTVTEIFVCMFNVLKRDILPSTLDSIYLRYLDF